MKKIILATLSIATFAFSANAQIKFGPEIGLNMATQMESGYSNSFQFGIRAGGIVDIALGDHFALQPGIFYTMMGNKFSISGGFGNYSGNTKINYLYVPVDVLYKFGEEGMGRFFVGAGPEIGYCLGGKETIDGSSTAGGGTHTLTVGSGDNAYIKRTDFGLNVLVGYQLSSGLLFRAGYYIGLSDVQSDANKKQGAGSVHNSAIQVSVGWLFGGNSYY